MKYYFKAYTLILLLAFLGCNKRINTIDDGEISNSNRINLPVFGSDSSFEILTWNVQYFPLLEEKTVNNISEIILDLDVDLIGFQEIADTNHFRDLLNLLPKYQGIYSQDVYWDGSYQKTAIIYKKDIIQISQVKMLFSDDGYSFPRPPLQVNIRAVTDQNIFDFTLIVMHLKAFGGIENEARRRSACQKLKNYLDVEILNSQDKDFMVVGDWNDELDDPVNENVFQIFLNDSLNYNFLTYNLVKNNPSDATYIGNFQSFIDHILISKDLQVEYNNGVTEVLKIDLLFAPYKNEVSDHRPVGAKFPVF
jgi:endonuclease/exonuclease/phosphatase family metal-dependent hydrolase